MLVNVAKVIRPKQGVALFFLLLALIGLLSIRGYGAPFDEYVEMAILRANIKEYALRLQQEQESNFYANLGATRISINIERDHGICAYYPLAPLLPMIDQDARQFSFAWSVLTWLWFMVGCVSLYGVLRALMITRPFALAGVLLLYLSPRFFAEGHYNNKDVVLLSLVLLTLWMGARLMQRPGFLRGVLFSLAAAAAANTKIIGILPWGLVGLALMVSLTANKGWSSRMAWVAVTTVASFVLGYLLLTPAAWDNPWEFLQYLFVNASRFSRFGGVVIFRGAQFYDVGGETPLPWYYLPYQMLVTIPLYTVLLAALGQLVVLGSWLRGSAKCLRQQSALLLMAITLSWTIPLGYAMVSKPILYNGWRHFYFVYAGIVILAGYGLHWLWNKVSGSKGRRLVFAGILLACFAFTGVGLITNHPYQYTYFNALQPRDARHVMDLDYWNVSGSGAFQRLYDLRKDTPGELRVGCYFNDITIAALKLPDEVNDKLVVTAGKEEPYLYYNSTYAHIYWAEEPPQGYHVLFTVQSYGNTVGIMYERDAL